MLKGAVKVHLGSLAPIHEYPDNPFLTIWCSQSCLLTVGFACIFCYGICVLKTQSICTVLQNASVITLSVLGDVYLILHEIFPQFNLF